MGDRIWDLFVELRKELLEAQKIRAQVMAFKITSAAAAIGILAKYDDTLDYALFTISALAAVCFDFIIYSYSFSIKRIGCYTRDVIEPALKKHGRMPEEMKLWQKFLTEKRTKQTLSQFGNLGVTGLTVLLAAVSLFFPYRRVVSVPLLAALVVFFATAILIALILPRRLDKQWTDS